MSKLTRYANPVDELFRGFFVKPMDLPADLSPRQIKMDVKEQDKSYEVHARFPA
jgi:HSP20 family protein